MIDLNTLTSTYDSIRFTFISNAEGYTPAVADDGAGIPSIGIGFNLQDDDIRGWVLNEITGNNVPTGLDSAIESIVDNGWVSGSGGTVDQINAQMASYHASHSNVPTTLAITTTQADDIYQHIVGTYEGRLNSKITSISGGIADSYERIALVSLAYNNANLVGTNLVNDINNGDRAEAWFEIRYKSNGGDDIGIAKRRYYESDMFSLYHDRSHVTDKEALDVYKMTERNTSYINSYDSTYQTMINTHLNALGQPVNANHDYNTSMLQDGKVDTYDEDILPAHNYLVDTYASGPAAHGVAIDKVWVDYSTTPDDPDATHEQNSYAGTSGNDLIFSGNGNDTLSGGLGDDTFVINGSGTKAIDGGSGNDTISAYNIVTGLTAGQQSSVIIDLSKGTYLENNTLHNGSVHAGTITGVENIVGQGIDISNPFSVSGSGDWLIGDANNNIIDGKGGYDMLSGGEGDDTYIWSPDYFGTTTITQTVEALEINSGDTIQLVGMTTADLIGYSDGSGRAVEFFVASQTDGFTYSNVDVPAKLVLTLWPGEDIMFKNPNGTLVSANSIATTYLGGVIPPGDAPGNNGGRDPDLGGNNNTAPPPPPAISDLPSHFPTTNASHAALMIDMDGNGIQVSTMAAHAVYFDVAGNGTKIATGWVDSHDALLVMDRNGNGAIDNGTELFTTNATSDGYTSLATMDSNSDGVINSSDTNFSNLKIWIDANQDGISQINELQTLSHAGIASISLSQSQTYIYSAEYGYVLSSTSSVTMSDTSTKTIGTGWAGADSQNTLHAYPFPINPIIHELPQERGYGSLNDLDVQMSLDATLLSKVQAIHSMSETQVLDPTQNFGGQFTDIMYLWDGNRGVNWENNSYYMDSRKYSFVQDISGTTTLTTYPGGSETYNFQTNGLWEKTLTYYEGTYLAQTVFHDLFANHSWFDEVKGIFTDVDALSSSGLSAIEGLISSSSDHAYDWSLVVRAVEAWVGVDNLTSSDYSALDTAIQASTSYTLDSIHDLITGAPNVIHGTVANETLTGTFVDDLIYGTGGGDTLIGGEGDDTLYGGNGSTGNTYIGGAGDDIYYAAYTYGNDTYHFTSGHDLILDELYGTDNIAFDSGVTLSNISMEIKNTSDPSSYDIYHQANLVIHVEGAGDITVSNQYNGPDGVQGVETLQFSDSSTLDLTHLNDMVYGTSGNDTMVGADRAYFLDDRLYGDMGNDSLDGGLGHNYLNGGWGDDTYHVGHGMDFITDGSGTDQVVFDNTFDPNLITFHFNELMNTDSTTQGLQIFYDGQLKVVIDQEFGFSSNFVEKVSVDGVHDFDIASMNWDQHGTEGNDALYAIQVDAIHNSVYGNGGDDVLFGSEHADDLHGGDGVDNLLGNSGNDHIYGDAGNDSLSGGNGDDVLHGGDGVDYLAGGAGADTFAFEAATAFNNIDTIADFNATDGDKLDIKDLLVGYTPGTSNIADFVTLTESGGNTTVSVDRDGAGSTYTAHQIATINNVTGLDVHDMLTNHNLVAA